MHEFNNMGTETDPSASNPKLCTQISTYKILSSYTKATSSKLKSNIIRQDGLGRNPSDLYSKGDQFKPWLGQLTHLTEVVRGFPQSLQEITRIKPQTIPSKPFTFYSVSSMLHSLTY
jgi:hypothetical protein